MEEKKVDGIKKLSKEDLKKSRKVVLDLIGEKLPETKKDAFKVDSVYTFPKKTIKQKPEIKNLKEKKKIFKKTIQSIDSINKKSDKIKEIISIPGHKKFQNKTVDFIEDYKQEEIENKKLQQKKVKQKEIKNQEKKNQELQKEKLQEEKIKQEEIKNKKLQQERQEKLKQEKIKNKKLKKEARKKRKVALFKKLNKQIFVISKRSMILIVIIFIVGVLLYATSAIVVLKINNDNYFTRFIIKHVPIPAYVTSEGIVEYSKYLQIKNDFAENNISKIELENQIKLYIAKEIILEQLTNKYNLLLNSDKNLYDEISKRMALDKGVNTVAVNRINKIKELIDKGGDFVKVSTKYGDELAQVTISDNKDEISYYDNIKNLVLNEISDIITVTEGYYIFRCYKKTQSSIGLSYVFIKSKTLEEYINEQVNGYKLLSLVD